MRKINLTNARLIIASHPSYAIDARMLHEFYRHGLPLHNLMAADPGGNVIVRRNRIVEKMVLPLLSRFEWFIFADHDHFPIGDQMAPFFDDVESDVVGCQYDTGSNKSWLIPDTFHMGLVRIHRRVFAELKPPWFKFEYNEEHTAITDCECNFFRSKVIEAGFTISRRGKVGHSISPQRSWHQS